MGTSFGRGGATTFQQDLANADCILIEESNMAEAHPVGFQWVMEAKARGATVIHVDPRFTRTSAMADLHVPLRAGTDIAFLGGIVNYVLEHEKYFRDYVVAYTNGPTIVGEDFRDTEDRDGVFSGLVERVPDRQAALLPLHPGSGRADLRRAPRSLPGRLPGADRQLGPRPHQRHRLRRGLDPAQRGGAVHPHGCHPPVAAGQHRAARWRHPGPEGHASIQGSTDIPTLYDLLPGYIPMPHAQQDESLDHFLEGTTVEKGFWGAMRSYLVSLLKAWWGEVATAENDFCFDYLPA